MKNASKFLALLLALLTVVSVLAMTGCGNTADDGGDTAETTEEAEETRKQASSNVITNTTYFDGVDWVNALQAGFVGDGKTPNDKVFKEYAKYNSSKPLYFPKGVYCFAETLNFPDSMYVKMDPEAELKCIAEEPLDYFITLRGQYQDVEDQWCAWLDYAQGAGIDGGIINCDYKAKCALGFFQGMHTDYKNFKILNVLEKGVQTLISETHDGTYNMTNVFIYNTKSIPGSYGVYDNGADNHFHKISVCNFDTAFYTGGGRFLECTAWNLDVEPVVETSTFAEIRGDQSVWYNPSVDTFRYGFKLVGSSTTSITDMVWITNKVFYPDSLQAEYPRTMFYADDPANAKIALIGLQFRDEWYLDFSNSALPQSTFLNVRAPVNYSYADRMKNFRNDLAGLLSVSDKLVALAEGTGKAGNATGATDFDTLTAPGMYDCELRVGKGGKNLPPVQEVGVLRVEAVGTKLIQTFIGTSATYERLYDGGQWSAWRS